jgi:gliding motility-associated-like protein
VNPIPNVNAVADQVLCNGVATTAVNFTGSVAGTIYNWTNNTPSIGLAASGTGNIASFTATNTTAVPVTATITVTPAVGGCNGTARSFLITVNPTPAVTAIADQSVCHAQTTTAVNFSSLTPGTNFSWTNSNTAIGLAASGTGNIPGFTATNTTPLPISGTITITPDANGCPGTPSNFTITVNPLPTVRTLTDTSICRNDVLVLTTTPGVGTYSWTPAGSVSNPNIASPNFIGIISQTLYVTGTAATGCSGKDTIDVTVKPLPIVRTINDTTVCSVGGLTLTTTGAQTYSWSPVAFLSDPNIASPVFNGNSSQTYYVTGTAANGCKAKDTVNISVFTPKVFVAPPDKMMCNASSVQLDGYNGTVNVGYLWSPGTYLSSTTIIDPIASPPSSMAYNVQITDQLCNVSSNFTVQVSVLLTIPINAGKSNDIDCANRSATLYASGGISYLWTPSTGLSNPNIANPVVTITQTQQYIVEVVSGIGCTNYDTVTVYSNIGASLARYMPNAFTPNGDGKNDCYRLKDWMHVRDLQFIIYDRWGEKMFATNNIYGCWDGTYKGKPALAGTYVFYIKAQTDCGLEEQRGNFLLIR